MEQHAKHVVYILMQNYSSQDSSTLDYLFTCIYILKYYFRLLCLLSFIIGV